MTRVHATSSCVQSDSIKGLAQSIAQPAYNRLLIAEPLLRRAVPILIRAFLVTILIGAFVQVLDQNRQKHAATMREIASIADLMKERIDHLRIDTHQDNLPCRAPSPRPGLSAPVSYMCRTVRRVSRLIGCARRRSQGTYHHPAQIKNGPEWGHFW